jgi:environmental stress-induced protein Ves
MDEATRVLRWDELASQPWKNGGGSTRSVAASPADAGDGAAAEFDWRVSVADVGADGPFSAFPGVERVIMLIEGTEMILTVGGATHRLGLHDTLAFPGAADTACRVPSGPTRDLNLMTRTGRARGWMNSVTVAEALTVRLSVESMAVVLVALTPGFSLERRDAPAIGLNPLDSVVRQGRGSVRVSGAGTVAMIRVHTRTRG